MPTVRKPAAPTRKATAASTTRKAVTGRGGKDRAVLELLGQIFQAIEELGSNIEIIKHRQDQIGVEVSNMDSRVRGIEKDAATVITQLDPINQRGTVLTTKLDDILKRLG